MRRLLPLLFICAACATAPAPVATTETPQPAPPQCTPGNALINASLWEQSSAEFRAISLQTFGNARRALDAQLADTSRVGALEEKNEDPSQPPAIVTDLDETVIDNTAFEARMVQAGVTYTSDAWKAWVAEAKAKAMPGAKEFLDYTKSRGVTIFYVTNRKLKEEGEGTRRNLENLGYPFEPGVETLLMRTDTEDKAPRRRDVAAKYRLVMLMGDDLNDFANMKEAPQADRWNLVAQQGDWWGTRWIIMPNAMYGSFERAAIGPGGTPCEQMERKVRALIP